jgi:hypothetical protein
VVDQRIDAAGLEGQLQELMDRFNRYVSGRHDSLALEFDQQSRKVVYVFDKSRPDDPHMDFIFTNKTALQAVRFRHFMADCRAIARDGRELDPIIERGKSAVLAFLEETYRDIMENFDPPRSSSSARRIKSSSPMAPSAHYSKRRMIEIRLCVCHLTPLVAFLTR